MNRKESLQTEKVSRLEKELQVAKVLPVWSHNNLVFGCPSFRPFIRIQAIRV
jgi:hypothetical protein